MKRILLFLALCFYTASAIAADVDYEQIYRDMLVPTHSYVHGIDPGENYDIKSSTWSPYPLFRLTSPIFFKSITIEPGYYLLTPREHQGNWYMLFKEAGLVKYIIPVYDKDITPLAFYDENLPKPKMKFSQSVHIKTLDIIGKLVPSSKRKPAPQSYLEATDLDNHFISLVIYWGNHKYYTIFRTIKL